MKSTMEVPSLQKRCLFAVAGHVLALLLALIAMQKIAGCVPADSVVRKPPPQTLKLDVGYGITMEFIYIPAGQFPMGSPWNESGRFPDETRHPVRISRGFYLAVTELTQEQWRAVMGSNRSYIWGDHRPVEHVSWNDAVTFCSALSAITRLRCRLPTEAEWEYACRAGSDGAFCFGDDETRLGQYAWYQDNCGTGKTQPVGRRQPNAWGLYDMHGNVREWCADVYGPYETDTKTDPGGSRRGDERVVRGGSWGYLASLCRCARRESASSDKRSEYIGFRVAVDPE